MKDFSEFTNLYPVSKTLRFELIPIGKTLENIKKNGIVSDDLKRAENYKKVKKIIDRYHKWFIEKALSNISISNEKLERYNELYNASTESKKNEKWKKEFEKTKKELRKEVTSSFTTSEVKDYYKDLGKKELIRNVLPVWDCIDENEKKLVEEFQQFTTYFTGYNENRENMYSSDEKSTAISYRIINDNLPKFIDNIGIFNIIKKTELYSSFDKIYSYLEPWLNVTSIDDIFGLSYFSNTLTQSQIEEYNLIIGGRSGEDRNDKIRGLNQYINEYNQKHDKRDRLPKFKMLYKQILSDRENASFIPEAFETVNDMFDSIETYYKNNLINVCDENGKTINIFERIKKLLSEIDSYDNSKIYIKNDKTITEISQKIFNDYNVIPTAINYFYENNIDPHFKFDYESAKTERNKEKIQKRKETFTKQAYLSLAELQKSIDCFVSNNEEFNLKENSYTNCVVNYFSDALFDENHLSKIEKIYIKYNLIEGLINSSYTKNALSQDEKRKIKDFLDSILEIEHIVKPLYVNNSEYNYVDDLFYSQFDEFYKQLDLLIPLYNKVRSFVTKKPYSTEKIKLNFNSPTLLNGWDKNKETSNLSIILRKDGKYYLGIINKNNTQIIENLIESSEDDCYEKMEYKLLPGPNKMLPKVFFSEKRIKEYNPSEKILKIKHDETFKKGENFSLDDCHELIDFYKTSINKNSDWNNFNFDFSDTNSYDDISQFFNEVSLQGYKLSFKNLSAKEINDLVDSGKLYLFQIYNKDFSEYSKGKPNLHTMYWNAVFDEKNLNDIVYKLNGQAEVFYRRASIPNEFVVCHMPGEEMSFRNPLLQGQKEKFLYKIIKDRRYTVDKFQFHVPLTFNFKSPAEAKINYRVLNYLKDNPDVNIIGIDRGERNLLYISLIDQKGNVILDDQNVPIQYSLNSINSFYYKGSQKISFETPYRDLLNKRENERNQAREQWDSIEGIKELKEGYISQVVNIVTKLMIKYNAILVMEDLNFGFKRGRFKVEKQVYQKFEKMLIDKLNYLVIKDIDPDYPGGLYNALQLTNKFESFKSLGKQTGFVFYVPAWDTSKIDPVTGFTNLFPRCNTVTEKKNFFRNFDSILFNGNDFEFSFDYDKFTSKATGTKTKWTIFTRGQDRYFWNRYACNGKGATEKVNVTKEIKKCLEESMVDFYDYKDIKNEISCLDGKKISEIYKLFNIVLSMRYSFENEDYILSPVADDEGNFFDSRKAGENLPKDADANGAYNIARKGLWNLMQINSCDDVKNVNLKISNKEWLLFAQNKPYLNNN